jgi:hypothetical protein
MKISDNNPLRETAEDRLEHLSRESLFILQQIDRRLDDIEGKVDKNTAKLEMLEEATSHFAYIPTRPLFLRYDHKHQDLYLQQNLKVHFDGNEADVLSLMFKKINGRPHKKKFYCAEVAEKFVRQRRDIKTAKAVEQTIKRIQTKLDLKFRVGSIFTVTTKEFYFSRR